MVTNCYWQPTSWCQQDQIACSNCLLKLLHQIACNIKLLAQQHQIAVNNIKFLQQHQHYAWKSCLNIRKINWNSLFWTLKPQIQTTSDVELSVLIRSYWSFLFSIHVHHEITCKWILLKWLSVFVIGTMLRKFALKSLRKFWIAIS